MCEARIDFTLLEMVTNNLLAHCCTEKEECSLALGFLLITAVDFQFGSAILMTGMSFGQFLILLSVTVKYFTISDGINP
jgi:hypothetical protein